MRKLGDTTCNLAVQTRAGSNSSGVVSRATQQPTLDKFREIFFAGHT